MYPKENRLTEKRQFDELKKKGQYFSSPYFFIYFLQDPSKKSASLKTKLGFIVSNYIGNAVERNHIKRELRELFRSWLDVDSKFSALVIARKRIVDSDKESLHSSVLKAERYLKIRPYEKSNS